MNIKLDENLPTELSGVLSQLGHAVDTVRDEGLQGRSDGEVWQAARAGNRFLITQDLDFSDARNFRPGAHPGVLVVRLREPTRRKLLEHLAAAFRRNDLRNWQSCLVVLSESRIRVHRPIS